METTNSIEPSGDEDVPQGGLMFMPAALPEVPETVIETVPVSTLPEGTVTSVEPGLPPQPDSASGPLQFVTGPSNSPSLRDGSSFLIDVINHSTVLADVAVEQAVRALQIQIDRDFAPAWGLHAILRFVPRNAIPDPNHWWCVMLDTSDEQGALGYHDLTENGLPLGKVFAKSDLQYGSSWTNTLSHELLEMIADPDINLCATLQLSETAVRLYAYEVCDACEDDKYGITITVPADKNVPTGPQVNVLVSDFVLPWWFESYHAHKGPYDFGRHITSPFSLLPGGYISVLDMNSARGWQQLTASLQYSQPTCRKSGAGVSPDQAKLNNYAARPRLGSRRNRRGTSRELWMTSHIDDLALDAMRQQASATPKECVTAEYGRVVTPDNRHGLRGLLGG